MISLERALRVPILEDLRLLFGDPSTARVTEVVFLEDPTDEFGPGEGLVVIAGRAASRAISADHLLDVTLREFAARGATTLVITGNDPGPAALEATGDLVHRLGLVVLAADPLLPTAELLSRFEATVHADAAHSLAIISGVVAALRPALTSPTPTLEPAEAVLIAERALGYPVSFRDNPSAAAVVSVDGVPVGSVHGEDSADTNAPRHDKRAADIVLTLTALAIERSLREQARTRDGAAPARDALLSELLVATDEHAARLSTHARRLGVPVDGWHRAFLLQPSTAAETWSPEMLWGLGRIAAQATGQEDRFLIARSESSLVLVETWSRDPRPTGSARGIANAMMAALDAHYPALPLRCGIGTAHSAVAGLRASVAEARVALSRSRSERVSFYDAAGMRPIIIELANAGAARIAVAELLQPLIDLGEERAEHAILTLQTWLDEQGSLARTADRLMVHRNTVAYRVRQARTLVDVDFDDPDQRLALQLACRAYLLTMAHE